VFLDELHPEYFIDPEAGEHRQCATGKVEQGALFFCG
jgi:hypothetical protein